MESMAATPKASVPKACNGRGETMPAYRFFDNDSVDWQAIPAPYWQQTEQRMAEQSVVLCLQDTTELAFNGQQADCTCILDLMAIVCTTFMMVAPALLSAAALPRAIHCSIYIVICGSSLPPRHMTQRLVDYGAGFRERWISRACRNSRSGVTCGVSRRSPTQAYCVTWSRKRSPLMT
jgi:hypothetical protein